MNQLPMLSHRTDPSIRPRFARRIPRRAWAEGRCGRSVRSCARARRSARRKMGCGRTRRRSWRERTIAFASPEFRRLVTTSSERSSAAEWRSARAELSPSFAAFATIGKHLGKNAVGIGANLVLQFRPVAMERAAEFRCRAEKSSPLAASHANSARWPCGRCRRRCRGHRGRAQAPFASEVIGRVAAEDSGAGAGDDDDAGDLLGCSQGHVEIGVEQYDGVRKFEFQLATRDRELLLRAPIPAIPP